MDINNEKLIILNEELGVSLAPVEQDESFKGYTKLDADDFAKINAYFRDVPYMLKNLNNAHFYSGSYRVIYDKGLGVLQKSAINPELFRANIVAQGTNNNITGQALLQELKPNEMMKLTNLILSAFSIVAIATNQYYLSRIDGKLDAIEKKVNEIQKFLEIDKESQLWADGEFLKEIRNSLQYIIEDDVYRQSTLTSVQSIRRSSLANIKLYYEQLFELKKYLDLKDNDKEATANLDKYKGYLPKFWYSVYLYEIAYFLEACLSKITDEKFLCQVVIEMKKIISMFCEGYEIINNEINQYIDAVKALKANEVPAKLMKSVGKILEISHISAFNPFIFYGAKGLGAFLDFGGDQLEKYEKSKKKAKKEEVVKGLETIIKPYSDIEPLNFQIDSVQNINNIYNKKMEIIVTEDAIYLNNEMD